MNGSLRAPAVLATTELNPTTPSVQTPDVATPPAFVVPVSMSMLPLPSITWNFTVTPAIELSNASATLIERGFTAPPARPTWLWPASRTIVAAGPGAATAVNTTSLRSAEAAVRVYDRASVPSHHLPTLAIPFASVRTAAFT